MKILIIDNNSIHTTQLARLFSKAEIKVINCENFNPETAEKNDLIVLSGGTHVSAADSTKKAYGLEIDFVKNTTKTIIGVCLGCQLIAKAFNGKLKKLDAKCHGFFDLSHKGKNYKVYESHRYAIEKLPEELILVAESSNGPEIIKHKSKPIYGFQFHPEVFPRKTDGKKLFQEILKDLNNENYRIRSQI